MRKKSLFEDVFGKGGLFDDIFGNIFETAYKGVKPDQVQVPKPRIPSTITSFADLKTCEFCLTTNEKGILVRTISPTILIDRNNNKPITYAPQWLEIREATLKPKTGWAFDLVDPVNKRINSYIGPARDGDHNHLATFLHLKSLIKK